MRGQRSKTNGLAKIWEVTENEFFLQHLNLEKIPLNSELANKIYDQLTKLNEATKNLFKHFLFAIALLLCIKLNAIEKIDKLGVVELKPEYFAYGGLGYLAFSNLCLTWLQAKTRVVGAYFTNAWAASDEGARCVALVTYPNAYVASLYMPTSVLRSGWIPRGSGWLTSKLVPLLVISFIIIGALYSLADVIWTTVWTILTDEQAWAFKGPFLAIVASSIILPWIMSATSRRPIKMEYIGLEMLLNRTRKRNASSYYRHRYRLDLLLEGAPENQ